MRLYFALLFALSIPVSGFAVDFSFYDITDNVKIGNVNNFPMVEVKCLLVNNEATTEEFWIHKDESLPHEWIWTAPLCINEVCFSPYLYDTTTVLLPGEADTLKIWFNGLSGFEGSGQVILSVYPIGVPGETVAETLVGISDGIDVLVVDGNGHSSYYIEALPGGTVQGTWPRSVQAPTASNLMTFEKVIWGDDALTNGDALVLKTFLDNDSKLLLSGQDIAWSVCDMGSPEYSLAACDLITNYLGADYQAGASGSMNVVGDTPDPIGGGLTFAVDGGAGNQTDPDGISANGNGNVAFEYDGTAYTAGVHANDGDMRAVFLSFGLEGIDHFSKRSTIMERTFDYFEFDGIVGVESGDGAAPARAVLGPNRPNPFNPTTSFTLNVVRPVHATVEIFDVIGRVVRTLHDGTANAGETVLVWDGADDGGAPVPSGVYFAEAAAGGKRETRKLTLIR